MPLCRFRPRLFAAFFVLPVALLVAATPRLVEGGGKTTWQYFDAGYPGDGWQAPAFDATSWKRGPAPLGYGDPGLGTEIGFGGNVRAKHLTAYFRHEFKVETPVGFPYLWLSLRVDDGAAVYLNGKEIARSNLPSGKLTPGTHAREAIDGPLERLHRRQRLPASALADGRNVIAVEVHQINVGSSDLVLDLSLEVAAADDAPKIARIPEAGREISLLYLRDHYIPAGTRIPDGYHDGGRAMQVAADGTAHSGREIIVVDRTDDVALQRHLDYAHSPEFAGLDAVARATRLALYVDKHYTPEGGRSRSEAACDILLAPHRGVAIALGSVVRAGVCRHRSLLFKILAEEAGLSVALVRGHYGSENAEGAHAWNELHLPSGEKLIIDIMNPRPGFVFPTISDPGAARYRTVDGRQWYPGAR